MQEALRMCKARRGRSAGHTAISGADLAPAEGPISKTLYIPLLLTHLFLFLPHTHIYSFKSIQANYTNTLTNMPEQIPKTQKAIVSEKADSLEIKEIPVIQPDDLPNGQALVKVLYSGKLLPFLCCTQVSWQYEHSSLATCATSPRHRRLPCKADFSLGAVSLGCCVLTLTARLQTDLHVINDDWPVKANRPCIAGHEGAGVIVGLPKNASTHFKVGDRVRLAFISLLTWKKRCSSPLSAATGRHQVDC